MKHLNTTNTVITLNDGSKVSKNFYDIIKNHAIARHSSLNIAESYEVDDILGEDLFIIFNTKAACKIFEAFITMVSYAEVPYIKSDAPSILINHFELMTDASNVNVFPF